MGWYFYCNGFAKKKGLKREVQKKWRPLFQLLRGESEFHTIILLITRVIYWAGYVLIIVLLAAVGLNNPVNKT